MPGHFSCPGVCAASSAMSTSGSVDVPVSPFVLVFGEVISTIQTAGVCCEGHSVSDVVTEPSHKRGEKRSIRGPLGRRGAALVCATLLRQGLGVGQVTSCDSVFGVVLPLVLSFMSFPLRIHSTGVRLIRPLYIQVEQGHNK